jgi:hypothetical protein
MYRRITTVILPALAEAWSDMRYANRVFNARRNVAINSRRRAS